jgi:trigger factor
MLQLIKKEVVDGFADVRVEITSQTWEKAQETALTRLASKLTLAGFRQGKVPVTIARNYIKTPAIITEAVKSILNHAFDFAIKESEVRPSPQEANPSYDIVEATPARLELKFSYYVGPQVELGVYSGREVKYTPHQAEEERIDELIRQLQNNNTEVIIKDEVAQKGDFVKIDFVGTIDGVPFEGGSATDQELELGSNTYIPGFEDQLIGSKAGDAVEVYVTFPDNYVAKQYASKKATFSVKVKEVSTHNLPPIDDELALAANVTGVATLVGLRQYYREELEKAAKQADDNDKINALLDAIFAESKISIPDQFIDRRVANFLSDLEKEATKTGRTIQDYMNDKGYASREQMIEDTRKAITVNALKTEVVHAIIKAQNLEVNNQDIHDEVHRIVLESKMKEEDVMKAIEHNNEFYNQLQFQKLERYLLKSNTFLVNKEKM